MCNRRGSGENHCLFIINLVLLWRLLSRLSGKIISQPPSSAPSPSDDVGAGMKVDGKMFAFRHGVNVANVVAQRVGTAVTRWSRLPPTSPTTNSVREEKPALIPVVYLLIITLVFDMRREKEGSPPEFQ